MLRLEDEVPVVPPEAKCWNKLIPQPMSIAYLVDQVRFLRSVRGDRPTQAPEIFTYSPPVRHES